jgi:ferric-dicitrate binding protein FerR (iron transport regulator)
VKYALTLLATCLLASAATPVASLRSSSDFQLNGVPVATAGVSAWPVMAGDKVASGASPATVRFTDGTLVTLGAGSQARIERENDGLTVRLISGLMSFVAAPASTMRFFSGATALQARAGQTVNATATGVSDTGASASRTPPPPPPSLSQK